ncbi:MAG TPA: hypothetical protein VGB73_08760 [Pyrinomonadaceae bacterium]|jgi:hypothetical protein
MTRKKMLGMLACAALLVASSASAAVAQEASTTYRGAGRDPFVPYTPPVKRKVVKKVPVPVAPPSIQERINMYKSLKANAMSLQQPAPKPTTALLLSEVQVTGIFRTPRGYAAMVEATPISLSYVIYPGEQFFNGQLVAIEENRLVFRRETRWSDGRREMAVDMKPLRQANAVEDSIKLSKEAEAKSSSSKSEATANQ